LSNAQARDIEAEKIIEPAGKQTRQDGFRESPEENHLDGILDSSFNLRYLQANFWRVKRRGLQTVSQDFMPETFLQRLVEEAIRHLL
jgi:hypothetical protein